MKPPMLPCFSENDLSEDCNSVSAEEVSSMNVVSLANAFRFLFTNAEISENRKIAGVQPCLLKASANTGAKAEPSSVRKQIGFSGSSVCRNPGASSGTSCAKPRVTRCSGTVNSDFGFRSFFLMPQKLWKLERE